MANYNLTNQTISSSFQQLLQKDTDTGTLVDGLGNVVDELIVTSSYATTASYAENVDDPTWDSIQNKPTVVSGSSQISFNGITDKPTLISGSSQIDYPQISNIPSGIISSSEQLPSGVVSGSSQVSYPELSNIPSGIVSSSSQVVLEDTTFTDGIQFQLLRTDGAGNLSFDFADRTQIEVRASEAIAKGDPLYVVSFNVGQNRVEVAKADASDPSKMPVYGLAYESVSQNTNTQMVSIGTLDDIDTQVTYDFQVGDTVYVAAGGGLTNVKPTGTNLIQNVGVVGRRNQNNGEIVVSAIGRSNDVPNIQQGYAWVGNASGVATPTSTSSWDAHSDLTSLNSFTASQEVLNATFATTGSNTFNGDETINGTNLAPGSTLNVKDGTGTPILQVNNATLSGLVGSDVIVNGNLLNDGDLTVTGTINGTLAQEGSFATTGSNTFTGDQTINGTNLAPGSTFIAKDGNGQTRLQVYNATLKGITGADVLVNGNTILDGTVAIDDNTRINGNLENTGSFTNGGDTTIVGTNLAPGNTFTAKDGNNIARLQVNNATLSGLVGSDVIVNGNLLNDGDTTITDSVIINDGGVNNNYIGIRANGGGGALPNGKNSGDVDIQAGNRLTLSSTLPILMNSPLTMNGSVLMNTALYQNPSLDLYATGNSVTNTSDYFEIQLTSNTTVDINSVISNTSRRVYLIIQQNPSTAYTFSITHAGAPITVIASTGVFTTNFPVPTGTINIDTTLNSFTFVELISTKRNGNENVLHIRMNDSLDVSLFGAP